MANDWDSPPTNEEWGSAGWEVAPSFPPLAPGREIAQTEEAPGLLRGVARGGWALPGLVGLDYETAAAAEYALRDPSKLAERGLGLRERFRWYRDLERERSRRGAAENPIRTGIGIGVGAVPSTVLLPQARAAEGAGLAARALASGVTAGTQSAAIEGGLTADLPPDERLKRMGTAGVAGLVLGPLAPAPSGVPSQRAIDAASGAKPAQGAVREYLRKKAEEEAFKSAAAGNAKSEMARVNRDNPARAREVGRFLLDENLIPSSTTQPDDIFRLASALASREGQTLDDVASQATRVAGKLPSANVDLAEAVRGPGRAAMKELSDDPFQPAAADQVSGHIKRLANKYANREALIEDFKAAIEKSGLDEDVADGLLDDLTLAAKTYLPGLDDVANKAAKAGKAAAREAELSKPERQLLQAYLASVAEKYKAARITPEEAWTVRQQLDRLIRGNTKALDPDRNVVSSGMQDFRRDLSDRIAAAMDEARLGDEWRQGNRRFGLAADARDVAEVGRNSVGNRGFGLSEQLGTGFGGGLGGGIGGLVGGPGTGIAGGTLGALGGGLVGHAVRKYGSPTAARLLDKMAGPVPTPGASLAPVAGRSTALAPVTSTVETHALPRAEPLPLGLAPAAATDSVDGGGGGSAPVAPAPTEGQQGHDEEQTPQHPADLAPRGEVAQPPSEDEAPTRHVSVTDRLASVLQSNPGALGQYAGPIAMRLRFGGPLALAQYDFVEQQRSPEYRAQRAKAIGDERLSLKSS